LNIRDIAEAVDEKKAMQWPHRLIKEQGILAEISIHETIVVAERIASLPENTAKHDSPYIA
jgi:cysteine synthase